MNEPDVHFFVEHPNVRHPFGTRVTAHYSADGYMYAVSACVRVGHVARAEDSLRELLTNEAQRDTYRVHHFFGAPIMVDIKGLTE